jgi:predicted transcriptional regulator
LAEEEMEVVGDPRMQVQGRNPEARRSLLQIRMDILKVVAQGNAKPTQIMYKANLSWALLKAQLEEFQSRGLLAVRRYGSRKKYELTEKGSVMLEAYLKLEEGLITPEAQ